MTPVAIRELCARDRPIDMRRTNNDDSDGGGVECDAYRSHAAWAAAAAAHTPWEVAVCPLWGADSVVASQVLA